MLPRVCVFLVAALCAGQPAVAADAESEILEAEKSWAAAVKALGPNTNITKKLAEVA